MTDKKPPQLWGKNLIHKDLPQSKLPEFDTTLNFEGAKRSIPITITQEETESGEVIFFARATNKEDEALLRATLDAMEEEQS